MSSQPPMTIEELENSHSHDKPSKEKKQAFSAFSTADTLDRTKSKLVKKTPLELFKDELQKSERQFAMPEKLAPLKFRTLDLGEPEITNAKENDQQFSNSSQWPREEAIEHASMAWRKAEKEQINKAIKKFYTEKKDLNFEYRKHKFFTAFQKP